MLESSIKIQKVSLQYDDPSIKVQKVSLQYDDPSIKIQRVSLQYDDSPSDRARIGCVVNVGAVTGLYWRSVLFARLRIQGKISSKVQEVQEVS